MKISIKRSKYRAILKARIIDGLLFNIIYPINEIIFLPIAEGGVLSGVFICTSLVISNYQGLSWDKSQIYTTSANGSIQVFSFYSCVWRKTGQLCSLLPGASRNPAVFP